jgi:hypothetical protein
MGNMIVQESIKYIESGIFMASGFNLFLSKSFRFISGSQLVSVNQLHHQVCLCYKR